LNQRFISSDLWSGFLLSHFSIHFPMGNTRSDINFRGYPSSHFEWFLEWFFIESLLDTFPYGKHSKWH